MQRPSPTLLLLALILAGAADAHEPAPTLADPRAAAVELPRRATERLDRGRDADAWQLLLDELPAALGDLDAGDDLGLAAAEVACLMLGQLTFELDRWPETTAALSAARPWPATLAPVVPARLDALLAEGLRRGGQIDAAVALRRELGFLEDLLVIGPFDNERGSGHDNSFPPEEGFDRAAPVRGKERPVVWRAVPVSSARGWIDVGALLRPADQVVAYLATALHAEAARTVVLSLGSSCAFKVFLNGVELAGRKVERPPRGDQDRVSLPLQPGWNALLVKLGVEDGPCFVGLRLTDLDGRAVLDVLADSNHLEQAGTTAPAADDSAALAPTLPERLAALGDSAEAARLLSRYHLLAHPDDRTAMSARRAAERAVALDPDSSQGLYLLAESSRAEGDSREEIAVSDRVSALKDVLRLDPEHVPALLDLADFSSDENPLPDRVDELTRAALAVAPDGRRALETRARHLSERDRDAEAERLQRSLVETPAGRTDTELLAFAAHERLLRGDPDGAVALLHTAWEREPVAGPVLDELLDLLVDQGATAEVAALVEQALRADPFDSGLMLSAAWRLEYAGAVELSRGLLERALLLCPEDTDARQELVRLDVRAGRLAEAIAHLDEVVRLDPGNDLARRHRALLAPEARDGFDIPYHWDALELAGLPLPETGRNDPVELLRRTTVHKTNPDGTEHLYEHVVLRTLNLGGVKALDTYAIGHADGASCQVYTVRVIHPDGSFERAPAPRRDHGSGRFYDLPPLAVGDLVDVEYRVDESEPDVFGEYFGTRHLFYPEQVDGLAPTRLSELVVIAPADVPIYASERNAEGLLRESGTDGQGQVVLRWTARDLPRPAMQTDMPDVVELGPVVDVTTYPDWDAFARWWWSFIEKEFDSSPALRAKVAELTAGIPGEDERVAAINRFVAQEIRYNSWPFGTHGYEPFKASTIFERRFGDCKDKSILLRQMLAEIGVEAVPVLINARWGQPDEPLDAAMVGLFNHCIAYLPPTDERQGYYLDATADHNPVGYLRADDQGARVLHVTPEGGELHDIPYATPEENQLRRTYEVELDQSGDGRVRLHDQSTGQYGVILRYRYGGEQGDLEANLARELNQAFGAVEFESVETSDLEDITTGAVSLEAAFRADDLWTVEGDQRSLRLGFDDLGLDTVASEPESERAYDVVLDRPFSQHTTVLWKLPEGAEVLGLPPDVHLVEPGLLQYDLTIERAPEGLRVQRRFQLLSRRIEREQYGAFRRRLQELRQADERTILVRPAAEEL